MMTSSKKDRPLPDWLSPLVKRMWEQERKSSADSDRVGEGAEIYEFSSASEKKRRGGFTSPMTAHEKLFRVRVQIQELQDELISMQDKPAEASGKLQLALLRALQMKRGELKDLLVEQADTL